MSDDSLVDKTPPLDDLETERMTTLRSFVVDMNDGTQEFVIAHYHDSGSGTARNLNFVTIRADGNQLISHTFHSDQWKVLREVLAFGTDLALTH